MSTPSILKKMVVKKKERLKIEKEKVSLKEMIGMAQKSKAHPSFKDALLKDGLSIIGEIKKASPSKGIIKGDFNPVAIAREYEGCVEAISVLTEEDFFLGSPNYLRDVAKTVDTPILRKDFIFDEYQIYRAKAIGASAVLLIVAILEEGELKYLIETAKRLGLDALVETHSTQEAEIALSAGAEIIGINNRDLNTFEVNLETTVQLAKMIPKGKILVSESGFHTVEDIRKIKKAGVNAVLVGESFMRSGDIKKLSVEFKNAYEN